MGRQPKFKYQTKKNGLVEEEKGTMAYSKIGIIKGEIE